MKLVLKAPNGTYFTYDASTGASLTANLQLAYCFPSIDQANAAATSFAAELGNLSLEPLDKVAAPTDLQAEADTLSVSASTMPANDSPALFELGRVVATPGALRALEQVQANPIELIRRHVTGDWLTLDREDRKANLSALTQGSRILSSYEVAPQLKVWLITEADRSSTCILLPDEY